MIRVSLVGRQLVEVFVDSVSADGAIDEERQAFIAARRETELDAIIAEENLRSDSARSFVETVFRDGILRTTGTAITKALPPASCFAGGGGHGEKKQCVIQKLDALFERFLGLSSDLPHQ